MPNFKNLEIQKLVEIMGKPSRHPAQTNRLNEADAEIIKLNSKSTLVITTDIISDEISWGLYRNPYLVGWMSAVTSLSDLAVTGAQPVGLLIGTHWGSNWGKTEKKKFYQGLQAALKKHKTFLLGGDTSSGSETVITSTAIGLMDKGQKPLHRKKINPGDFIFADGTWGPGPALGLRVLSGCSAKYFPESLFKPVVSFYPREKNAHAAIDVSDGLASSLSILSQLNRVSFDIMGIENLFNQAACKLCLQLNLPLTALFFAEHGDYQALFAVAPKRVKAFKLAHSKAKCIAVAKKPSESHRIQTITNQWQNIQLDEVYNADKSDLKRLQIVFKNWVAKAKQLGLP